MDSINITVTGRLGADPQQGTTRPASRGPASPSPPTSRRATATATASTRPAGTRSGATAPAPSTPGNLSTKGDRVTVRADDVTCRAWTEDAPGHRARGQVELKAYDVSLSLRFDERRRRPGAPRRGRPGRDRLRRHRPVGRRRPGRPAKVREVLAGVTR